MLLYRLEQAPMIKTALVNCKRSKMPLPASIANQPVLFIGLEIFIEAFYSLTRFRSISNGENPISWESINAYANEMEMEGEQRERMFVYVSKLDEVYLKFRNKKIES